MNKNLLKQIIAASYKNGELDTKTVAKISEKLDRSQLKQYIRALKNAEKLNTVYIESPVTDGKKLVANFQNIFPNKKITFIKNSSLIAGVRINYNDDIFEVSVKNNLEKILNSISEDYD